MSDGGAGFLLPRLSLSATGLTGPGGNAGFSFPVLTLSAAGITGDVGAGAFLLPVLRLSAASGVTGDLGSATFQLPVLTLRAHSGSGAGFNLPILSLASAGVGGGFGTAAFRLPVLSLSGGGAQFGVGTAAFRLPMLRLSASAATGSIGSAAFRLLSLRLSAAGATGVLGAAAFRLPVLSLSSAGLANGFGTAAFSLPLLYLDARGALTLAENYRTWVLNTRKATLTEYDFEFLSYAIFNGQVLGVTPTGVVVLGTQSLDDTAAIDARARTGKTDGGTSYLKRVPRIYSGLQQGGDMIFRTIFDETGTRSYLLPWLDVHGYTQRRVPVGKGPKGRFIQVEWENVAGSDFSIKDALLYPNVIGRRVQ